MSSESLAPLVLFAHRRPDHLRRALESLRRCPEVPATPIYIYCDGAADGEQAAAVAETRAVARELAPRHAVIIERDSNFGLSDSLLSGINDVLDEHDRIIVFEEDLVASRHFLEYMNRALLRYAERPSVMHVCGYNFPTRTPLPSPFFMRPGTGAMWGWGTWRRAWMRFEPDSEILLQRLQADPLLQHEFNVKGTRSYTRALRSQIEGRIDTFSVRWYGSIFLAGGLCLYPGRSLIHNAGQDGSGEHGVRSDIFDVVVANNPIGVLPFSVEENLPMLEEAMEFNRRILQPQEGDPFAADERTTTL